METVRKNSPFTVVTLIILVCALAMVISVFSYDDTLLDTYGSWLQSLLSAYMVFIFIRTAGHLLFSFANTFFQTKAPLGDSRPLVTIIVPCYNEEKVVAKAIQSVASLTYSNFEILVIDDGSKDDTLTAAIPFLVRDKTRIIHQNNAGKAAALNRGISEALGEYIFCMDADSLLAPDVLERGLGYFKRIKNLGAVAGTVAIGNGNQILTAFQRLEYISGLNLFKSAQSFLGMVTVIPGPVGLFKRSAVLEVGGYLPNTFAEDCELTIRLLMRGYSTVYEPMMVAVTEAPETLRELVQQRYRWSRGVVQALRQNLFWLTVPGPKLRNALILAYLWIESICIPVCNFLFGFLSIEYALTHSNGVILGAFFLNLMLLDIILALFCVVLEQAPVGLMLAASVNRFTYGFGLEILRFFAIIDEIMGLPMSWGKLTRRGLGGK